MTTGQNTPELDVPPRGRFSVRAGSGDDPEPGAPEPRPSEPPPGVPSPDTGPEVQPVHEPTPAPSPTRQPMPDRELPHVIDPVASQLHTEH